MSRDTSRMKSFLFIQWAVVGVVVALVAGMGLASSSGNWQLRNILARWTVLSLQTAFVLAFCLVILAWKDIRSALADVSRRTWLALGSLLVVGFLLVVFLAPRVNRIYYDEQIYQNIAQNIAWTGKAFLCNEGNAEHGEYRPYATEYNKQPNGHPYYISLFFKLFGVSELSAHMANYAAFLMGALAVFLIVRLLFESNKAALFASAFFMGTPMVPQWAGSTSAEPTAAAFAALAIAGAALFLRARTTTTLYLFVVLLAIGLQFRPESIFVVVPAGLLMLLMAPRELARPRFYGAALLFVLLVLSMIMHLYAVRHEDWGSSGDRMALSILWQNLPVNGPFYYQNDRFPVIFTVFALLGLLVGGRWREKSGILIWFILLWGIFLFFYAGSYSYGADVRFSVLSAAPLAVFSGLGAGWLANRPLFRSPAWLPTVWVSIVALMLWLPFLPLIRAVGEEAVDARLDVHYARKMVEHVPVDAIVLSHNPSMWLVWGKNSTQLSTAMFNQDHVENNMFARYKGGVFMHWGFWCNVPDPGQNRFGHHVREHFDLELVQGYDVRGFHYALYRIYPKGSGTGKVPPGSPPMRADTPEIQPLVVTPAPPSGDQRGIGPIEPILPTPVPRAFPPGPYRMPESLMEEAP